MRKIVEQYIFGPEKNRAKIHNKIKQEAVKRGIFLSSLIPLYKDIAKGNLEGFSVPAFNIRTLTFDIAKSVFRAAKKEKASAFILEIASSEMEYTYQTPDEYAICCLGAAIDEKFKGQVFLQGDHFYLKNAINKSVAGLQNLILRAFGAGFYNIDIDCSALALPENIEQTIDLAGFIKQNQPQGINAAIGGEVSSIGGVETTQQELETFLRGAGKDIIKVSCQLETRHGGKILPSGDIELVEIDFEKLKRFSEISRQYNLAGIVQHGASTLKEEQFSQLVEAGVLEVHLSTLFQNLFFESAYLPKDLKEKMYAYISQNFSREQRSFESEKQFFYAFRKKALGIFKKEIWQMPKKNINGICEELEEKFRFFFKVFGVNNTKDLIKKLYQ
ncbi:MAG: class II fructose-bisphosphate aldolase [Candidatus Pacebacteria bacterium]|nr:class II fructose-bisphosphate aldolase [Candidatus Paceibacterota bacterium]